MIVSINQPAYLPWLGYFERIAASDVHVVLDTVQFEKNSFTNRNKVRTSAGWCWLTVPVRTSGRFGDLAIRSVEIENATDWRAKHWRTIRQNYARAPFFREHEAFLASVYETPWTHLADLCATITGYFLGALGIETRIVRSSELSATGAKDELVLNLCRELGATTYLSGALGRNYLREPLFDEAGIAVEYQDYTHPVYPQSAPGFEPYMAILDLLVNCGPRSRDILTHTSPITPS